MMRPALYGFVLGAVFVLASLAGHGCATLTQPPKSWPPQPSCAQDPTGPTCVQPIHDERPR
jgi:hypothetical protein